MKEYIGINERQNNLSENFWYILKGYLIVLVVIGHLCQGYMERENRILEFIIEPIFIFIYSFHMPCFVYISGYFSKNLEKRRKNAFNDLFIPFIVFNLFFGLFYLVMEQSINTFRNIFSPEYGLWYLLALFIWRTFMPDLVKIKFIFPIAVIINLIGAFFRFESAFALNRTIGFFVFFLLGYFTQINDINKIRKISPLIARTILIIEFIFVIIVCYKTKVDFFIPLVHQYTFEEFTIKNLMISILVYVITLVIALVNGILFIASISRKDNMMRKIGKDTLPIYISHLFVIKTLCIFSRNVNDWSYLILSVVFGILMVIGFSTEKYRRFFNKFINIFKIKNQ